LDTNEAHAAAIRRDGLRIEGGAAFTTPLRVESDAAVLAGERFDAVLFMTKSGQTAAAAQALGAVLDVGGGGQCPLLVTLQNGMGNSETLAEHRTNPIARGVTLDAGRYIGPGRVEHLIRGNTTWLGPVRGSVADSAWLVQALNAAGMPAQALDDPMDAVWSKFVFNCVMNPVGALLLGVNAARYQSPETVALIDDMAAECQAVVAALGGRLVFEPLEMVRQTRAGLRPITRHAGSMALDIKNGARTEIDELTGFIVREGLRLGVPVSACRTVYRLVKGLEVARAWQLADTAVTPAPAG
ncbi:MAG: 2-dehydropantoate 2-reductase, partial [Pseudomonadota bacterium]